MQVNPIDEDLIVDTNGAGDAFAGFNKNKQIC